MDSSEVRTVQGNINLIGTGDAGTRGSHGILMRNGSLVQSTGGGSIDMTGISNANSTNHDGITIIRGSGVETNGTGTITMTGIGGYGTDNEGIVIILPGTRVTSENGDIVLRGTSRGSESPAILIGRNGDGVVETSVSVPTKTLSLTISSPLVERSPSPATMEISIPLLDS